MIQVGLVYFACYGLTMWHIFSPRLRFKRMTAAHNDAPIRQANTALPTVSLLVGFSAVWWTFYAVPMRRKEWLDIMLDYGHHKRTRMAPNLLDKVATTALRMLRMRV